MCECVFECEYMNCVGKINEAMLYIVLHGSELVGVMSSPVDAHLIAKPLQAQVWTCQPNSTDATLVTDPILPSDRPRQAVAQPEPRVVHHDDVGATHDSISRC